MNLIKHRHSSWGACETKSLSSHPYCCFCLYTNTFLCEVLYQHQASFPSWTDLIFPHCAVTASALTKPFAMTMGSSCRVRQGSAVQEAPGNQANTRTKPSCGCQNWGKAVAGTKFVSLQTCLSGISSGPFLRFQLFMVLGRCYPPVLGAASSAREVGVMNPFDCSVFKRFVIEVLHSSSLFFQSERIEKGQGT